MDSKVNLPYFDLALENENSIKDSLHMHWGYWEDPSRAIPKDPIDLANAMEHLCRLVVGQVDLTPNAKLADVGCGFGGTIDTINQTYHSLDIVGLNIDPRQLQVAKKRVIGRNKNKIEFITGNACDLPFEDSSLDALLAVECIFHFPDRKQFFREVSRVLKSGGKFAFSDFVPAKEKTGIQKKLGKMGRRFVSMHFGGGSETMTMPQYHQLADGLHLKNTCAMDVTTHIMPTFTALFNEIEWNKKGCIKNLISSYMLWWAQRSRQLRYMIIGYQKQ